MYKFWRVTKKTLNALEVIVFGHDDKAIIFRVIPYCPIVSLVEADQGDM